MRLGLIGDIHGNADALSAVLEAADRLDIRRFCITGDFVGYYHQPARVMALLQSLDFIAVRGNHDEILQACLNDSGHRDAVRKKYGSGIDVAIKELSGNDLAFLAGLPMAQTLEFDCARLLLAHGAPWSTEAYIYPDAPEHLWQRLQACGANYVVLGHTHYQYDRRTGDCQIVNPGSVGQPRDRRPGAAWSILDVSNGRIEHRRESYDMRSVIHGARIYDPGLPYLQTVLTRT
jgi:putative phosphoesterase